MNGVWYVKLWGFSVNEGGTPMNLHMQWFRPWCWLFIYIYVFGRRFTYTLKRNRQGED